MLSVPVTSVGSQAVGAEAAPQGGAADAEPARGLGKFAVCRLKCVEDRLALPLGEGVVAIA